MAASGKGFLGNFRDMFTISEKADAEPAEVATSAQPKKKGGIGAVLERGVMGVKGAGERGLGKVGASFKEVGQGISNAPKNVVRGLTSNMASFSRNPGVNGAARFTTSTAPGAFKRRNLESRQSRADAGLLLAGQQRPKAASQQMADFQAGKFNLEADIQTLSEKGIDQMRGDLSVLDAECSDEIKRTVQENYRSFIHVSQGIGKLEGELQQLRNLQASVANLVTSLKSTSVKPSRLVVEAAAVTAEEEAEWADTADGVRWAEALDEVDTAIAERRCLDALQALRAAEKLATHMARPGHPLEESAEEEVEARREALVPILEALVTDTATGPAQTRLAAGVLASVAGRAHALTLLLHAHTARVKRFQQHLLKPQNTGGGATDGTDYAGGLAQRVFRTIGQAADDAAAVFRDSMPELSALFLVWALQETERCALLLKRHALTPFAAPAGLGATVSCVVLMLTHCMALEESHGLKLAPRLNQQLWPAVEQVIYKKWRRIGDDMKAAVALEVDRIAREGLPGSNANSKWAQLMTVFPSADVLLDDLQGVVGELQPLAGPRTANALRKGVSDLFQVYCTALASNFNKYKLPDGALPPRLDPAVEPAMEVACYLSEQFLPDITEPLASKQGQICHMNQLFECVENLGEALGLESVARSTNA